MATNTYWVGLDSDSRANKCCQNHFFVSCVVQYVTEGFVQCAIAYSTWTLRWACSVWTEHWKIKGNFKVLQSVTVALKRNIHFLFQCSKRQREDDYWYFVKDSNEHSPDFRLFYSIPRPNNIFFSEEFSDLHYLLKGKSTSKLGKRSLV